MLDPYVKEAEASLAGWLAARPDGTKASPSCNIPYVHTPNRLHCRLLQPCGVPDFHASL